jgi:hypothetical protein
MKKLNEQIDGSSISIFRIGFGIIMLWELFYFLRIDFVKIFLIKPKVQFTYEYFSFVKPLPEPILDILIIVLLVCCLFILIGKHYRKAMIVFFIGFSYLFLLDKAYYNNHLYLICLLSFLLILIPADAYLSFRSKNKTTIKPVFYWHLLILRLQLAIVYFYGGIAKLNYDWLVTNEPVRTLLENKAATSFIGELLSSKFALYFFTYGGVGFDLLIPFLLFIPRTRIIAVVLALSFNIMNALLFDDINIFPYFMMLSLILFLDPAKVAKYIRTKFLGKKTAPQLPKISTTPNKILIFTLGFYFLIQMILPFRYLLYPGNVDWTGLGQRFAWRMKIQHRSLETMEFKVWDINTKTIFPVEPANYGLNHDQITLISHDPRAAVQFAKFIKQHCKDSKGMDNVLVKSNIVVSFNGRPAQQIFAKELDLGTISSNSRQLSRWIEPLKDQK